MENSAAENPIRTPERLPPVSLERRLRAEEVLDAERRRMERDIADTEAAARAAGHTPGKDNEIKTARETLRAEEAAARAELRRSEEEKDVLLEQLNRTLSRDRILGFEEHKEHLQKEYPLLAFSSLPPESVYGGIGGTIEILKELKSVLGEDILRKIPLRVVGGGEALRLARNGVFLINPLAAPERVISGIVNSKLVRELQPPAPEKAAAKPEPRREKNEKPASPPQKEKKEKKLPPKTPPSGEGPRGPETEKIAKADFMHLLQGFERAFPNARVKFRYGDPGAEEKTIFQRSRRVLTLLHQKLGPKLPVLAEVYFRTSGENRFVRSRLPYAEVNIASGTPEEIAAKVAESFEAARQKPEAMVKPEPRRGAEWYAHLENQYHAAREKFKAELAPLAETLGRDPGEMLAEIEEVLTNVRERPNQLRELQKIGIPRNRMEKLITAFSQDKKISEAQLESALKLGEMRRKIAASRREHLAELRPVAPEAEKRAEYQEARKELRYEILKITKDRPEKLEDYLRQIPPILNQADAAGIRAELQDLGLSPEETEKILGVKAKLDEYRKLRQEWFAPEKARIAEKKDVLPEERTMRAARDKYSDGKRRLAQILGKKLFGQAILLIEGRAESPEKQDRMLQDFAASEKLSRFRTRTLWEALADLREYRIARTRLETKLYENEEERLMHVLAEEFPPEKRGPGEDEEVRLLREGRMRSFRKDMLARLDAEEAEYLPRRPALRETVKTGLWSRMAGKFRRNTETAAAGPAKAETIRSVLPPIAKKEKTYSVLPPITEAEKIRSILPPNEKKTENRTGAPD